MKTKPMKTFLILSLLALYLTTDAPEITDMQQESAQYGIINFQHTQTVAICKAIKQIESRGNYTVVGGSQEYGAYQFTPATWTRLCQRFMDEELDIRITTNQDLIAYLAISRLVDKGYMAKQIASIWNSGSSKWNGKIGINKYGVKYNVPSYVNKFNNTYKQTLMETIEHQIDNRQHKLIIEYAETNTIGEFHRYINELHMLFPEIVNYTVMFTLVD